MADCEQEKRSLPAPQPREIQVAVGATGLCGSDLHYYNHFRNGDILVREPLSLGHESAGTIVAVGSDVQGTDFKVGDKIALEVGVPCGACDLCKEGRYNICKKMSFRSSGKSFPHFQGTLQERINHPAAWCHKMPEGMSLKLGALIEPLSVALHASRRANLPKGNTVLVLGAGAVGLLAAAIARVYGAKTVILADIDQGRIEFGVQKRFATGNFLVPKRRGADIDENLAIAKETAAALGEVKGSDGQPIGEFDAVFECTGVPSCVQAGIYATRPGGKLMLIGMGTPIQTLPLGAAALREVDVLGVFRYANTYPEGIRILSSNDPDGPDFAALVTHRFKGLEHIPDAFQMAGRTQDDSGKLVLKVMIDLAA